MILANDQSIIGFFLGYIDISEEKNKVGICNFGSGLFISKKVLLEISMS